MATKEVQRFSKSVILKLRGKDDYVTQHYLVFKVVLKDDKKYTVDEAKKVVKDWLESEVK